MIKPALFAAALVSTSALAGCLSFLPEPFIPSALIALPAERATAPSSPLLADAVHVTSAEASRPAAVTSVGVAGGATGAGGAGAEESTRSTAAGPKHQR